MSFMRDAMMKSFRVRPAAQQLQCDGACTSVDPNHSGHYSAGTECDDHVTQPGTSKMEQTVLVASDKLHCPPAATIPIGASAWQEGLVQPPVPVQGQWQVCLCVCISVFCMYLYVYAPFQPQRHSIRSRAAGAADRVGVAALPCSRCHSFFCAACAAA